MPLNTDHVVISVERDAILHTLRLGLVVGRHLTPTLGNNLSNIAEV